VGVWIFLRWETGVWVRGLVVLGLETGSVVGRYGGVAELWVRGGSVVGRQQNCNSIHM
jgi:hypothetical protein